MLTYKELAAIESEIDYLLSRLRTHLPAPLVDTWRETSAKLIACAREVNLAREDLGRIPVADGWAEPDATIYRADIDRWKSIADVQVSPCRAKCVERSERLEFYLTRAAAARACVARPTHEEADDDQAD